MDYLIILTLILTPAYSLRFDLFGFPTNLLMVWIFFVWLSFIIHITLPLRGEGGARREGEVENLRCRINWKSFLDFIKHLDKRTLILTGLFFLAGLISLFVRGLDQKKLGQFTVLFLQPISVFFIAGFIFSKNPEKKSLLLTACYLLLAAMGIYAIIQYFTLLGLPPAYWGNSEEPKRALGFFSHPNFYALFVAPLLALMIPDLGLRIKDKGLRMFDIKLWAWLIGVIGLLLSMSRAGWLGLAAALAVYLIAAADLPSGALAKEGKKIRKIIFAGVIVIVIVIVSVPNLRWRFILPFYGEKSAVSRVSLWQTGVKAVKESPVLGLGLTGFAKNWDRLNADPNIDNHNFPHNIFLNFWVETGLLGLISFIGLIGLFIYRGLRRISPPHEGVLGNPTQNQLPITSPSPSSPFDKLKVTLSSTNGSRGGELFKLSIALFLIALVTQGLLDNPYFKNDLAMVFWIILSLFLSPIHGESARTKSKGERG
jgi:O-antigen ligase